MTALRRVWSRQDARDAAIAAAAVNARGQSVPLKTGRQGRHHITRQNPAPLRVADVEESMA